MIFDTDVLIWWLCGDQSAQDLVQSTEERQLSVISQMEVMQGVRSKQERQVFQNFLREANFSLIAVNEPISYAAVRLIEDHALSEGLQFGDALIGATARHVHSILITGNVRHFRFIRGLELKPFRPGKAH